MGKKLTLITQKTTYHIKHYDLDDETLIKDLQPAYDIIDNLEGDKEQLEVLKDEVENMIKEEKW